MLVSGYYGFGNAGDEIILTVLRRVLRRHEVTVLSADPEQTRREHGVRAVARLAPLDVARALLRCQLLVSGGGGLLQDATGPASVPYYLGLVAAALALGRPVMIYAQGVGPLHRRWTRAALRLLRGAAALTVRDAESAELLQRQGVRGAVVTADAVLSLPAPAAADAPPPELADLGVHAGEPVLAVVPRPYGGAAFVARIAAAADRLADRLSARVVLVPMQASLDAPVCREIAAAMRREALILTPRLPAERYPAVFAGFSTVVGMRLHALVLAALAQRPAVGLAYDPKITAFLHEMRGAGHLGVSLNATAEEIAAAVCGSYPVPAQVQAALAQRVAGLARRAAQNDALLAALLARL